MNIVKTQLASLTAPFGSADTAFTLTGFLDAKGNALSLANFGTWLVIVLKSGSTTEMIKCSSFANNGDGTTTFTISSNGRNLDPTSPYAGYATGSDFPAGADALVTNDPYTMSQFLNVENDATIEGKITFAQVPTSNADPVSNNDLTRKSWVSELVLGTLTTIDVIVPGTAGGTITAGELVYFDTATNEWKLCSASTAATVLNTLLGIAQSAATTGNPIANGVLLQGVDANQSGLVAGNVEYASNTPGGISPTPGTTVVAVGLAKDATHLYFAPRFDQQITQDQINALAGMSGTALSSSNKVEDAGDTASVAAANKLVRANGSGVIDPSFLTGLSCDVQEFTTPGANTWTMPAGAKRVMIEMWAGGGSGAAANEHTGGSAFSASGAGGGEYIRVFLDASSITSPVTVTIGAGGAAVTCSQNSSSNGNDGGNTTFGSYVTAHGGKAGGLAGSGSNASGGSGGSPIPIPGFYGTDGASTKNGFYSAAGGGYIYSSTYLDGGNSVFGGGGGGVGGTNSNGGTSVFGGNGGGGSQTTAAAGSTPAGGGGASFSGNATSQTSGKGGDGKAIITTFK